MALRTVESGIPRTYGGSLRLAGHGVDAIVRAKIGLVYSVGHTVGVGVGKGVRAAKARSAASKTKRAELASAKEKVAEAVMHPNKPIVIGAVAGLAMVGAGLALLKFRAGSTQMPSEIVVEDFDDDSQLDEATV